jgi:hypothetical protein
VKVIPSFCVFNTGILPIMMIFLNEGQQVPFLRWDEDIMSRYKMDLVENIQPLSDCPKF